MGAAESIFIVWSVDVDIDQGGSYGAGSQEFR
jgi:hypothetical protein